jgi:hypothetical protein
MIGRLYSFHPEKGKSITLLQMIADAVARYEEKEGRQPEFIRVSSRRVDDMDGLMVMGIKVETDKGVQPTDVYVGRKI